jgi:hypothetical protein
MHETDSFQNKALRTFSAAAGVLVGFFSVEHGFFEILQGNTATPGVQINAIGPVQRFWEYGTERAFTVVPNFLVTGILAVLVGLLVIMWSVFFLQKKHGAWIFFGLTIAQFAVGGGFAPFTMALFITIAAGRINAPLTWSGKHFPAGLRDFFARRWPLALVVLIIWSLVLLEIGIFGYPLLFFFSAKTVITLLWILAYSFLAGLVFSILSAITFDIRTNMLTSQASANIEKL